MRKRMLSVLALLMLLLTFPLQAAAQKLNLPSTPLKNRPVQIGDNQATVTFADLGYRGSDLVSPYDTTRVLFSIPPNWKLIPGGTVQIVYEVVLSGADANKIIDQRNPYGGALTVTFNGVAIGSMPMEQLGTNTAQFQLPADALTPFRQDGRHELAILLNAQFSCVYDIHAIVSIKNTSVFNLMFEASSPPLDLSKLPAPFYLRNSLLPDSTMVVTSDQPSKLELQSALNVMAGLGSMISDKYQVEMTTVSQLTDQTKSQSNLIFVGKPDGLALLSGIQLPLAVSSAGFTDLPQDAAGDGVLEMALSPWNPNKVVLVVSGADDAAVAKAAQAVSSGKVFIYQNPALAYVSEVQSMAPTIPVVEDFTLESLGYTTETLNSVGLNNAEFLFSVAKEQVAGKGGYLDLQYYHSSLLDYGVSSLSVLLNDQIIGSAVFNKDSEQLTSLRINIPPGILRFGENRLTVTSSLLAQLSCDTSGFSDPWLVISDQSGFHLPVGTSDAASGNRALDLKFFPGMFMTRSDLGDVAFVLPQGQPVSWKVAGQIAYKLGWDANPLISSLQVAYADDVSTEIREQSSLIVVGKASDLPVLKDFNQDLPAPFDMSTNTASERDMQIVYRMPPGVSVGYLELMTSPYSAGRMIMLASGNDDSGLLMAGNTLTQDELSSRLAGQFAISNGVQVATGSLASAQFAGAGATVPNSGQVMVTPVVPVSASQAGFVRPNWLNILPWASALVIVLVLLYVVIVSMQRRRELSPTKPRPDRSTQPKDQDNK